MAIQPKVTLRDYHEIKKWLIYSTKASNILDEKHGIGQYSKTDPHLPLVETHLNKDQMIRRCRNSHVK